MVLEPVVVVVVEEWPDVFHIYNRGLYIIAEYMTAKPATGSLGPTTLPQHA